MDLFAANAKFNVEQKRPVDAADDYDNFTPEVFKDKNLSWETNALLNAASLDEISTKIGGAEKDIITDLRFFFHGQDNGIQVIDPKGNIKVINIDSKEFYDFLFDLKYNKKLIAEGTRLQFYSCAVAESEKSRKNLQFLADEFGIEILAAPRKFNVSEQTMDKFISFLPKVAQKSGEQIAETTK